MNIKSIKFLNRKILSTLGLGLVIGIATPAMAGSPVSCEFNTSTCKYQDFTVNDPARNGRQITYRLYWENPVTAPTGGYPLIVVSHGGRGNLEGHTKFASFADEYVRNEYVSVHISHPPLEGLTPAEEKAALEIDRPADVKFVLDRVLLNSAQTIPNALVGKINAAQIGAIGHSNGGYTVMAISNGLYYQGGEFQVTPVINNSVYRDARIKASVVLSPQGACSHGSWALSPTNNGGQALRQPLTDGCNDSPQPTADTKNLHNTWSKISIPMFNLIGECELNGEVTTYLPAPSCSQFPKVLRRGAHQPDWRRIAFDQYNNGASGPDRFEAVVPGADHGEMGGGDEPDEATRSYNTKNSRVFFDVFLRAQSTNLIPGGCGSPFGSRKLDCIGYMTSLEPLGGTVRRK